LEYRYAAGQLDQLPALAAELVRLPVDVIVTWGTQGVQAAQQATTTIPIVVGSAGDLAAQGIVASLARPGGNITGVALLPRSLAKHLELLKEAVPTIARVALLFNPANPGMQSLLPGRDIEAVGQALGVQVQRVEARHPDALDAALLTIAASGVDALLIHNDAMLNAHFTRIAEFAVQHRLPAMTELRRFAQEGGLLAYGPSVTDMARRAAVYVDKILKGARPADLPVERADKLSLVINLKTAAALGLMLPPTFLFQADEVIK
jgi:putative ABC transport system substrate-binding protein